MGYEATLARELAKDPRSPRVEAFFRFSDLASQTRMSTTLQHKFPQAVPLYAAAQQHHYETLAEQLRHDPKQMRRFLESSDEAQINVVAGAVAQQSPKSLKIFQSLRAEVTIENAAKDADYTLHRNPRDPSYPSELAKFTQAQIRAIGAKLVEWEPKLQGPFEHAQRIAIDLQQHTRERK